MEKAGNDTNKKVCPNCGTANLIDARFCENCGTDMGNFAVQRQQVSGNGYGQQGNGYGMNQAASNNQYGNQEPNNGYGQAGSLPGSYGTLSSPPQPMVKKPIPKWLLILIAEAVLLVFSIYGSTMAIRSNRSPERVAESFFVDIANGDWEQGYSELDVEGSEFINGKMFAGAIARNNILGIVTNYQIESPYDKQGADGLKSLYELADNLGLEEYLEQGSSGSSFEKTFEIDYRLKGDTEKYSYLIMMNQTPEGWKVEASNFICRDFCIYVPKGLHVSLDGIELGEKYLLQEGEEGYEKDDYNSMDSYSVPEIFYGDHEIKITMEDMEDVSESFQIGYGDYQYRLENVRLKEEVRDMLIQKAGENMQQIYSAALAGKNFSAIENLFFSNEEMRKQAKEDYEYLLADLNEGGDLPTRIIFQNIEGKSDPSDSTVYISLDYIVEYKYESWSGDWKDSQSDGSEEWTFGFRKENGNWVQTNLGCQTLYY